MLVPDARLPKLNDNQQLILAELAAAGGTLSVEALRQLPVPESTLATLVRRELIIIEERPQAFHLSGLNHTTHELNFAQQHALKKITEFFEVKEGTRQFQAACCTASPAPAKPLSISRPCSMRCHSAFRRSCSSPKSD